MNEKVEVIVVHISRQF